MSIGDLPSYSNQTSSLCQRPVCHLVRFGFDSGDADGILTNGCLYKKNISRVEFGFNSGDADGILTNGCLYTKNISRVEFGFNSGDADGILTNGCLYKKNISRVSLNQTLTHLSITREMPTGFLQKGVYRQRTSPEFL